MSRKPLGCLNFDLSGTAVKLCSSHLREEDEEGRSRLYRQHGRLHVCFGRRAERRRCSFISGKTRLSVSESPPPLTSYKIQVRCYLLTRVLKYTNLGSEKQEIWLLLMLSEDKSSTGGCGTVQVPVFALKASMMASC